MFYNELNHKYDKTNLSDLDIDELTILDLLDLFGTQEKKRKKKQKKEVKKAHKAQKEHFARIEKITREKKDQEIEQRSIVSTPQMQAGQGFEEYMPYIIAGIGSLAIITIIVLARKKK